MSMLAACKMGIDKQQRVKKQATKVISNGGNLATNSQNQQCNDLNKISVVKLILKPSLQGN